MSTIVNRAWRCALIAAALSVATAYAGTEIDFAKIPDVRIFKGDETVGYRDPAAWYEDGVFHLFFSLCDPSVPLLKPGIYTLAVSVGRKDGKPEIALPLEGGIDRIYPVGKIEVVNKK